MSQIINHNAEEIYNYMVERLAEGIYISEEDKAEMINEIKFLMETS